MKKRILMVGGLGILAIIILILKPYDTRAQETVSSESNTIAANELLYTKALAEKQLDEELSDEKMEVAILLNQHRKKYGYKFKSVPEEMKQKLYGKWEVGDSLKDYEFRDITRDVLEDGRLELSKEKCDVIKKGPIYQRNNGEKHIVGYKDYTESYTDPVFVYYEETQRSMIANGKYDYYWWIIDELGTKTTVKVVMVIAKDSSFPYEYQYIKPVFYLIDDDVLIFNQEAFYPLERVEDLNKVLLYNNKDYEPDTLCSEDYTKKSWIVDDYYEGSSPFSFVITKMENGIIEGKVDIGGYFAELSWNIGMRRFSGVVEGRVAKCQLKDKNGESRTLELTFLDENRIKGILIPSYSEYAELDERKESNRDEMYLFRPYNLKDEEEYLDYEILAENVSIYNGEIWDFWGKVNIVTGIVNTNHPYAVTYLTNENGDILYDFFEISVGGDEVKNVLIEDVDGDGLKDFKISTWFPDAPNADDYELTWILYQREDGLFYEDEEETIRMFLEAEGYDVNEYATSENRVAETKDSIRYDDYAKKMWVVDDYYEGSSPFAFVITKVERKTIEGKVNIGNFVELNEEYDTGNEMKTFSGVIEGKTAKCQFEDKNGISKTLELTFLEENKLLGTLKPPYDVLQKNKNHNIGRPHFFRPYNSIDAFESVNEIFAEKVCNYRGDGLKEFKRLPYFSDIPDIYKFIWIYNENQAGLSPRNKLEIEQMLRESLIK